MTGSSTDYPATVVTTWNLAFEQARASTPASADLLALCAFLAPEAIPLQVIRHGAEYLPTDCALASAIGDDLQ
jgi:hypothetical protein